MFLFSLNWPRRDRANGKFLPTSPRSGGGVGVCVKRGPVPSFVFNSTFKSLVQTQSTKITQHFTVTDSGRHCRLCGPSCYYVRKLSGIHEMSPDSIFYCSSVFSLFWKASAQSSGRVLRGDCNHRLPDCSPPYAAMPSRCSLQVGKDDSQRGDLLTGLSKWR